MKLTKKLTEQVRLLAKDENEELAGKTSYDVLLPYDQAKALGKTSMDVDRIAAGLPCGSEGFLLMLARWRKLAKDLYNERREYVLFDLFPLYTFAFCILHSNFSYVRAIAGALTLHKYPMFMTQASKRCTNISFVANYTILIMNDINKFLQPI